MMQRTQTLRPLNALLKQMLHSRTLKRAALGIGAFAPAFAFANPTGGQVVAGNAGITVPDQNHTIINQASQSAIINWQQFSIGSDQFVQFIQPDSSAVVLNRVVGGDPSQILGNLSANGQVFLVNPNGVFFGQGASLDVQGLIATTLDIKDNDFMAGNYVFAKGDGAPDAGVTNQGTLRANNGYIVLAGDYVNNDGVIAAQAGQVVLASGNQMTLTLADNSLVSFVVNQATMAQYAGVSNTGSIEADGGTVLMTAKVANALTATAVNNSGLVTAHSIQDHDGTIILAAQGGDIDESGTLDASATDAGVAGGNVIIRGNGHTEIASTASINASGNNARGGFIELSGHTLSVRGDVNLGHSGTLLIDPVNLFITDGISPGGITSYGGYVGTQFINGQLQSNNDVVLIASGSIHAGVPLGLPASIHAGTNITATGTGNLTIKTGSLQIHSASGSPGDSLMGSLCGNGVCVPRLGSPGTTFAFTPTNGTIDLSGVTINIKGGFTANAGPSNGTVKLGPSTTAANINVTGRYITTGALTANSAGPSAVSITGSGSSDGGGYIRVAGNIVSGGGVKLIESGGSSISVNGSIQAAGLVSMSVNGNRNGASVNVGGNISAAGPVSITATDTSSSAGATTINVQAVTGKSVTLSATAVANATISAGTLHANGTGAADGVSLTASDSSGSYSGGRINVSGNIVADHGGVTLKAVGGEDAGGTISVIGNIVAAGNASITASNIGSCCGFIKTGTVTAGGEINIRLNETGSGNAGISVGSLSAANGRISVEVHNNTAGSGALQVNGFVKAGNGSVNLINSNGSGIYVAGNISAANRVYVFESNASSNNLSVSGNIKGSSVQINDNGSGSINVQVGNVTASRKLLISASNAMTSGHFSVTTGVLSNTATSYVNANPGIDVELNGGSATTLTIGGIITTGPSGSSCECGVGGIKVRNAPYYFGGSIHITGAVKASHGSVSIAASGGALTLDSTLTAGHGVSLYANSSIIVHNVTAGDEFYVTASGSGGVQLGNVTAGSINISGATIHAGTLQATGTTASEGVNLNASITAYGGAAIIQTGSIKTAAGNVTLSQHHGTSISLGSSGGKISTGAISAGGALQITTTDTAAGIAHGGDVMLQGVKASAISVHTSVGSGGNISADSFHATGPASTGIVLVNAHANGAGSGGNITVNGNITAAGNASIEASNFSGSAGAGINLANVTGRNVFISAEGHAPTVKVGALTATGPASSGNIHVLLDANSGGSLTVNGAVKSSHGSVTLSTSFGHLKLGASSSAIHAITAAQGVLLKGHDILVGGITAGGAVVIDAYINSHYGNATIKQVSGNTITGSNVAIELKNPDSLAYTGNITLSNVTATGTSSAEGIVISGDGGSHSVNIDAVNLTANGGDISLSDVGTGGAITVSGTIQTGANFTVEQSGSFHGMTLGNVTAGGEVHIDESGTITGSDTLKTGTISAGGSAVISVSQAVGAANVTVGNVTAGSNASIHASDTGTGAASLTIGNINAKKVLVTATGTNGAGLTVGDVTTTGANTSNSIDLYAAASGQAATITTGNLTTNLGLIHLDRSGIGGGITVNGAIKTAGSFLTAQSGSFVGLTLGSVSVGGNFTVQENGTITGSNTLKTGALTVGGYAYIHVNQTGGASKLSIGNITAGSFASIRASDTGTGTESLTAGNINAKQVFVITTDTNGVNVSIGDITTTGADTLDGIDIYANGVSHAADMTTGNLTADAGNISLINDGTGGTVTVNGTIKTSGSFAFSQSGDNHGATLGVISAGQNVSLSEYGTLTGGDTLKTGPLTAGGNATVYVNQSGGVSKLSIGNIAAGAYASIRASDTGTGTETLTIGNINAKQVLVTATGANGASLTVGDIITTGANTSNSIDMTADGGSHAGNIITGNLTTNLGQILLHDYGTGGSVTVNGTIKTSGSFVFNQSGGNDSATFGDISAGVAVLNQYGSIADNGALKAGDIAAGHYADIYVSQSAGTANVTIGNITAGSSVHVSDNASAGSANLTVGNVNAKHIQLNANAGSEQNAVLTAGNLTASNSAGSANIQVFASGQDNIITTGAITVTGKLASAAASGEGGFDATAAAVTLGGSGNTAIKVNGGVTISAAGTHFQRSSSSEFSSSNDSGSVGTAHLDINNSYSSHGSVDVTGAINVTGMGGAYAQFTANKVTLESTVNITATPGKAKQAGSYIGDGGPLNITYSSSAGKAGSAYLAISAAGDATLADAVTVEGPLASVVIHSRGGITVNGITVTASGEKLKFKANGTGSSGSPVNFSSSQSAGSAQLVMSAGSSGNAQTVNVTGGIVVTGVGRASVDIQGDTINTKSISVTQTAGKYSRTGMSDLFSSSSGSGPGLGAHSFGGNGSHGLLRIQQGTLTGGIAEVRLQGMTGGSSCSCQAPANSITVGGDISVSAAGDGEVTIAGQTVGITGGITGTAERATVNGTGSQYSYSGGSHYYSIAHSVSGSGGRMHVDIRGTHGTSSSHNDDNNYAGTVTIGDKIDLTGPVASVEIKSGNITTHDISVNGTGEDLSVTDAYTPSGSGASFTIGRSGIIEWTGIDLAGKAGTGKVTTGDLLAEGPLFAAVHIGAGTVTVGNVGIIASSGSADLLDTRISTTILKLKNVGDAGLAISDISGTGAAPVFTPATVNGNVNLEAARDVHLLSDITVSGYTLVTAGRNIDDPLSADLRRFINDDRHGSGSGSSSGDVPTLSLDTGGLALLAGGDIILNDAVLKVGTGSVPGVVGDSAGVALLAAQELASTDMSPNATFVAGGTLGLGKFTLTGDYLYMEATDYNLSGTISVPTGTVVQFAPVSPTGSIDVEPGPSTAGTLNLSGDLLNLFPGTTLMVGVTGATGDVTIGSQGTISLNDGSNFLLNTEGSVTGLENILTTGLVGNLLELVNFQIPTANEIQNSGSTSDDTSDEKKKKGVDTGGGDNGDGGGTVEHDEDSSGVCHG